MVLVFSPYCPPLGRPAPFLFPPLGILNSVTKFKNNQTDTNSLEFLINSSSCKSFYFLPTCCSCNCYNNITRIKPLKVLSSEIDKHH